jgi:transposase
MGLRNVQLDERIETVSREIEEISRTEENCANAMSIPSIGPLILTAMVAAIGRDEAFDRGRDFAAWIGLKFSRAQAMSWPQQTPLT